MAFNLGVKNQFFVDTSGKQSLDDSETATFVKLAAGISSVTPTPGDTTDNTAYYDGGGFANTDVTGLNYSLAFTGNRVNGDAAQDYISGLRFTTGDDRKVLLKHIDPLGNIDIALVTLSDIIDFGGDANAKQTFSFTANFDGAPQTTPATTAG
ncbi:MAG: phage tail tube protein [Sporolactobacillus sp.]